MDREFAILNKECEIGLLDTQYIAVLNADELDLDKLRNISNQIDDAYDELLDLYQEQLDEILISAGLDEDADPEEISIAVQTTVERMAEICAIMFQ